MGRVNLQRTGVSSASGIHKLSGLKWRLKVQAFELSPPVVADGIVYFGSGDHVGEGRGYMNAVQAGTGRLLWRFKAGDLVSPPAIADGTVYFSSGLGFPEDAYFYAVNAKSGRLQWKIRRGSANISDPAVADGTVYFTGEDNHLYALDARTGKQDWRLQLGGGVSTPPSIAGKTLYFGGENGALYSVDIRTRRQNWAFKTGEYSGPAPAVAETAVCYLSGRTFEDTLHVVSVDAGKRMWQFSPKAQLSAPAVADNLVYIGSYKDYSLIALDLQTGDVRWKYRIRGARILGISDLVLADGTIYFTVDGDGIHAVDASTGKPKWQFERIPPAGSDPPAIDDGAVYFTSDINPDLPDQSSYVYAVR